MIVHHVGEHAPKDLRLDATRAVPRYAVWQCWSEASLLVKRFCPKPWRVTNANIDLKPKMTSKNGLLRPLEGRRRAA